jgi:hypothetical protein
VYGYDVLEDDGIDVESDGDESDVSSVWEDCKMVIDATSWENVDCTVAACQKARTDHEQRLAMRL